MDGIGVLDPGKKIRVLGLSLGIDGPPPGVDKVLGSYGRAVIPLGLAQVESISQPVLGNLGASGQARTLPVLAVSVN